MEAVVHRCLRLQPEDRYPTARALSGELRKRSDELLAAKTRGRGRTVRAMRSSHIERLPPRARRQSPVATGSVLAAGALAQGARLPRAAPTSCASVPSGGVPERVGLCGQPGCAPRLKEAAGPGFQRPSTSRGRLHGWRRPAAVSCSLLGLLVILVGMVSPHLESTAASTAAEGIKEPRSEWMTEVGRENDSLESGELRAVGERSGVQPMLDAQAHSKSRTAGQHKLSPHATETTPSTARRVPKRLAAKATPAPARAPLTTATSPTSVHQPSSNFETAVSPVGVESEHSILVREVYINGRGELVDAQGNPLVSSHPPSKTVLSSGATG